VERAAVIFERSGPHGHAACRLIKAAEGLREAKVIAYTGNASIPASWIERWFVAIVPKPSTPDVLLAARSARSGSLTDFLRRAIA
jgi:CheY-like chemotaxis protein